MPYRRPDDKSCAVSDHCRLAIDDTQEDFGQVCTLLPSQIGRQNKYHSLCWRLRCACTPQTAGAHDRQMIGPATACPIAPGCEGLTSIPLSGLFSSLYQVSCGLLLLLHIILALVELTIAITAITAITYLLLLRSVRLERTSLNGTARVTATTIH